MKIRLRRSDMGMTHQGLNRLQVISFIEKGGGERVPDYVGVDSLTEQSLFRQGFDETINGLCSKWLFLIGAMFTQGIEDRIIRIGSVSIGLQILLYGDKSLGL